MTYIINTKFPDMRFTMNDQNTEMCEIPTPDGESILMALSRESVYNVRERTIKHLGFKKTFPFIGHIESKIVSFSVKRFPGSMDSMLDNRYDTTLSLKHFCSMLGVEYKSIEQIKIEGDIKYGGE